MFLRAPSQERVPTEKGKLYVAVSLWGRSGWCKQPVFVPAPSILRASPSQGSNTALLCAWPSREGGKLSVNIFIFMVTEAAERKALILQAPRPLPSSGDRAVTADPGVPSPTPKLQAAARVAGLGGSGPPEGTTGAPGQPRGSWICLSQPAGFLRGWVARQGREDPETAFGVGRGPRAGAE